MQAKERLAAARVSAGAPNATAEATSLVMWTYGESNPDIPDANRALYH